MHFGYLRQENEHDPIDKLLSDTWKLFQKKLSDAADFVGQQTLIIKERLRDTFDVRFFFQSSHENNLSVFSLQEIFE